MSVKDGHRVSRLSLARCGPMEWRPCLGPATPRARGEGIRAMLGECSTLLHAGSRGVPREEETKRERARIEIERTRDAAVCLP